VQHGRFEPCRFKKPARIDIPEWGEEKTKGQVSRTGSTTSNGGSSSGSCGELSFTCVSRPEAVPDGFEVIGDASPRPRASATPGCEPIGKDLSRCPALSLFGNTLLKKN